MEDKMADVDPRLPTKSALELRKTADGLRVVRAEGDRHVFTPAFLERMIEAEDAEVTIRLKMREGDDDLVYNLVGFERVAGPEGEEPRSNLTAWIVDRVEG